MEEENKIKEDLQFFKLGHITDRRDVNLKLSDRENYSNKSNLTQNPEEALFPNKQNNNPYNINGNDSKMSLETFRTMFKNKNKELREYKESLDKKIEMLRNKIINSKKNSNDNSIKKNKISNINIYNYSIMKLGRNPDNKELSKNKAILESTLKENSKEVINNINFEKKSKKNFEESYLFSLKKENKINSNPKDYPIFDLENQDKININYNLFSNTFYKSRNHEKNFYTLLSFLNNNDLYKLFNINRSTRQGIITLLKNKIIEYIIPKYKKKYCNNGLFINDSSSYKIILKSYKKNKKAYIRIILSIKAKICLKNNFIINKKHQIVYQILNQDDLENSTSTSYTFEVIPKPIPKRFWIYKEYTSYHYDDFDKAYYNDLLQFWPGDDVTISIGLINELGILDFRNFHWLNPKIVPKLNKENIDNILVDSYLTNSENTCEVEGIIHSWIGIEQLESNLSVLSTLTQLFGNNFDIKEVYYEDVGYYFFKIILEAKKEGECGGINNNLGINIKIYNKNKHICNEIKKNGLIYDENNNELCINIDDIITFYISQNK